MGNQGGRAGCKDCVGVSLCACVVGMLQLPAQRICGGGFLRKKKSHLTKAELFAKEIS